MTIDFQSTNEGSPHTTPTPKFIGSFKVSKEVSAFLKDVYDQVSSRFTNMAAVDLSTLIERASQSHQPDTSPSSLVAKARAINFDWAEVNRSKTLLLQEKLQNLETVDKSDDTYDKLTSELQRMKLDIEMYYEAQLVKYMSIDSEIGKIREASERSYAEIVKPFDNILINYEVDGMKHRRKLKPPKYFSDLYRIVSSWFPNSVIQFQLPGNDEFTDIVATQHEFISAFKQSTKADVLTLVVVVGGAKAHKRTADEYDSSDNDLVVNLGHWSNVEESKFAEGVEQYGWGKWSCIARHVETRSRHQTRKFARGRGARYENNNAARLSINADVASALKTSAEALKLILNQNVDCE
jgi:hypothetical protein